jgi:carotenoid cleavage dioxygenase
LRSPFLDGTYAPVHQEIHAPARLLSGEIPRGLVGTLMRNGANPRWPPHEPYHWFTGDGMVHAITFGTEGVTYRNRWVRTPRFLAEEAAGQALFAGFGQPIDPRAAALDTGVANTHVIGHADRILALEEAHLPMRLTADLETLGYDTFGGVLEGRFTAHPKHDPRTGELVFFSYSARGALTPTMSWGAIGPDGAVRRYEFFDAPYCSMVHDFAVTAKRIVFPILPLTGDLQRAMSGRPVFAWEPSRGAFLGVMERAAGVASLRWLEIDPCFVYHVLNAYEAGDEMIIDLVEYDHAPLFPNADGSMPTSSANGRLARWHIGQDVRREVLDPASGEFPRLDERYAGLPYRYGFRLVDTPEGRSAIAAYDMETRERKVWTPPEGDVPSEAVFAPSGASEGEGYLLSIVSRTDRDDSRLVILDARTLTLRAEIALPQRVPAGFHGSWLAAT